MSSEAWASPCHPVLFLDGDEDAEAEFRSLRTRRRLLYVVSLSADSAVLDVLFKMKVLERFYHMLAFSAQENGVKYEAFSR